MRGPASRARLGDRDVVLADVDAVGAAGADEVGAVVDDEEGVVAVGRARGTAARLEAAHRPRRCLSRSWTTVAAADQRHVEQAGLRAGPRIDGVGDEVEARRGEPFE